jgi:RNA polymerase sigma-70 factor (ECF subfamily)
MDKSFEVLALEHYGEVFAFVYAAVRRRDVSEDLTQETFLAAFRSIDTFDTRRDFRKWLRGIARNKVLNYLNRTAKRLPLSIEGMLDVLEDLHAESDAAKNDTWRERAAALTACLKKLPQGLRHIIRAFYYKEARAEDIAQTLGISPGAVWQRLYRSRMLLKECIDLSRK